MVIGSSCWFILFLGVILWCSFVCFFLWFLVVYGFVLGSWWFLVVLGGYWKFLLNNLSSWWLLVILGCS